MGSIERGEAKGLTADERAELGRRRKETAELRPAPRQMRQADLDAKVKASFDDSGGTYGSRRIVVDLRCGGERVSKKTWRPPWSARAWWPGPSATGRD